MMMTAKMPTPLDVHHMRDRVIAEESSEFVSWMTGQRFMVTNPNPHNWGVSYLDRVGVSKYDSVVESYTMSGLSLIHI